MLIDAAPLPNPEYLQTRSVKERVAEGRAVRKRAPLERHAVWSPPKRRADPVEILERQAAERVPELVPIRYGRMELSAFAFYRGAAAIMAADLSGTPLCGLRAQLCGDAHLLNFGMFETPERSLIFGLNDFDETLPGPIEWDVKRLAASVEIAGRDLGFGASARERAVQGNRAGVSRGAARICRAEQSRRVVRPPARGARCVRACRDSPIASQVVRARNGCARRSAAIICSLRPPGRAGPRDDPLHQPSAR